MVEKFFCEHNCLRTKFESRNAGTTRKDNSSTQCILERSPRRLCRSFPLCRLPNFGWSSSSLASSSEADNLISVTICSLLYPKRETCHIALINVHSHFLLLLLLLLLLFPPPPILPYGVGVRIPVQYVL